jgi:hypothetical protein
MQQLGGELLCVRARTQRVSEIMKKYVKWGAIAFALWYVLNQPSGAATVIHGALGGLSNAAGSLSQFVNQLP